MMTRARLKDVLQSLRHQAVAEGTEKLGSHQLDAHWSIAYACQQPPETWEIYRVPWLDLMPYTDFYVRHPGEIQEALTLASTWELLQRHAIPKLELEACMSEQDGKRHGYPGRVQYYDATMKGWLTVDVPSVRWFDGRDFIRESVSETRDEFEAKVAKNLRRYREAAAKDPSPRRLEKLAGYRKFIREMLPERLKKFDQEKDIQRAWLTRLEATPDFSKALFTIVREAENEVRKVQGIPLVGEAWVSETELLSRIRQLFPETEVIHHGQPKWLGRQHLDIWLSDMNVAIEYQGEQHYRAIGFFGGEDAFRKAQERDNRKRDLCQRYNVRLVEIAYDHDIDDAALRRAVMGS